MTFASNNIQLSGSNTQLGNAYPTDYKIVATSATPVTFSPMVNEVTIVNHNPYSGLTVSVNGGPARKVHAGGKIYINGQSVTSLSLQALAAPCRVSVAAGMHMDLMPPSRKSIAEYTMTPYSIVCLSGNVYIGVQNSNQVMMCVGDPLVNANWSQVATLALNAGEYISKGVITSTNKLILWTSVTTSDNTRIFTANLFSNQPTVGPLTFTETTPTDSNNSNCPVMCPYWHGMDSSGDTIVFAEYTIQNYPTSGGGPNNLTYPFTNNGVTYAQGQGPVRIWTSTNGGQTWTPTLTVNGGQNGSYVRHMHSVNFHQSTTTWIVTSGDSNGQTHWWWSGTASSWVERAYIQNLAAMNDAMVGKFRSLNVIPYDAETVMWGSDAGHSNAQKGIFMAPITSPESAYRVCRLPNSCWGIAGNGQNFIAVSAVEGADTQQMTHLFVSTDGGYTWNLDLMWQRNSANMGIGAATDGGFFSTMGPDAYGRFYVSPNDLDSAGVAMLCVSFNQGGF